MSGGYFEMSRENRNFGNYIPSGRQLPRTPPLTDVKRHLDFGGGDPNNDCAELQQNVEGDLEDMQRLLKKEMMALELTLACKEKALAELNKFPSCEELTEWVKVVLKMTSPLSELSDLDAKSLLTMVTKENVQKAVEEKRIGLTHMEKMLANK
eukprot:superscaffoldBa00001488_g10782